MSQHIASEGGPTGDPDGLALARQVILDESQVLQRLASRLDERFCAAVDAIVRCRGVVVTVGMGKAGLVARKLAATFSSTGTRSLFLHPSEALHGDLGVVSSGDVAIVFSHSGQTREIVCLVPILQQLGVTVIAVTGQPQSELGRIAKTVIPMGPINEAGPLQLAPTCSTTAMMALGDALALTASDERNFCAEDFARFHPAGNLGRMLSPVRTAMRPLERCRVGNENQTIREIFVDVGRPGRRTGAVILTDDQGVLTGLFTDSDLARLFEHRREDALDQPMHQVMTHTPTTILDEAPLREAIQYLASRKISELPVVDAVGFPLGLIDITDVVAMLPTDSDGVNTSTPEPMQVPSISTGVQLAVDQASAKASPEADSDETRIADDSEPQEQSTSETVDKVAPDDAEIGDDQRMIIPFPNQNTKS